MSFRTSVVWSSNDPFSGTDAQLYFQPLPSLPLWFRCGICWETPDAGVSMMHAQVGLRARIRVEIVD